jgi:hypothetical protein
VLQFVSSIPFWLWLDKNKDTLHEDSCLFPCILNFTYCTQKCLWYKWWKKAKHVTDTKCNFSYFSELLRGFNKGYQCILWFISLCNKNNLYEIYSYNHSTDLHCYKKKNIKENLKELHIYVGRSNINWPLSIVTNEWSRLGNDLVRHCGGLWGLSSPRHRTHSSPQLVEFKMSDREVPITIVQRVVINLLTNKNVGPNEIWRTLCA